MNLSIGMRNFPICGKMTGSVCRQVVTTFHDQTHSVNEKKHMGIAIINHQYTPIFDDLYHPCMVIRAMVYHCYTNITIKRPAHARYPSARATPWIELSWIWKFVYEAKKGHSKSDTHLQQKTLWYFLWFFSTISCISVKKSRIIYTHMRTCMYIIKKK